jgi:hypothetical protein
MLFSEAEPPVCSRRTNRTIRFRHHSGRHAEDQSSDSSEAEKYGKADLKLSRENMPPLDPAGCFGKSESKGVFHR